jgi:NAD(P)-dependent dehydrogenase (short-subunit alcohol dehydrogenase family)
MMTKALSNAGAHKVYIIGRRKPVLDAAAASTPHGNIIPLQGDVSSKASLRQLAEHIKQDVGYINLLIPNSGIGGPPGNIGTPGLTVSEFVQQAFTDPMEEFTQTYHVNVTGVYYTVLAFLELLDQGNQRGNMGEVKSQIIATSSLGGWNRTAVAGFAYCTSKAAVTHLVKQFATYFVPWGIRCNAFAPGCKLLLPFDLFPFPSIHFDDYGDQCSHLS